MGNIVQVTSITDYEDEQNQVVVGFGPYELQTLKDTFAKLCGERVRYNSQNQPIIDQDEFKTYFSNSKEGDKIIQEIFNFDGSGEIDYYKFICGMSLINSADFNTKGELLWPVYCRDHKNPEAKIYEAELSILVQTCFKQINREEQKEPASQEDIKKQTQRLLKAYGKENEGTRSISLRQWQEMFSSDLFIMKLFYYLGCISKFGGGIDMPEFDQDLEEEIRKGEQDDDFLRIERIKNGIEHNEGQKKDGEDDPTIEKDDKDPTPWKGVTKQIRPRQFSSLQRENNPPTAILDMEYVYGFRCHDTRNSLKIGSHKVKMTENGEPEEVLIYHTAQIGIVQSVKSKKQRFFMEHNDDITCLDIRENFVVTGQLGSKPIICVWDYTQETLTSSYVLSGVLTDGIAKVCFSRFDENDENRILTKLKVGAVSLDDMHSIAVWDLEKVQEAQDKAIVDPNHSILAKGENTRAPCWDLKFTRDNKYMICASQNEVGFFTYYGDQLRKTKAIWDPKMNPQSALCVGLLHNVQGVKEDEQESKGGLVVTGMYRGELCLWKNGKQIKTVRAHQGPCTSIITRRDNDKYGQRINGIVSGGNDGEVKLWKVNYIKATEEYDLILEKQYNINDEQFVKGLDLQNPKISAVFQSREGTLIVGTRGSQVVEIEPTQQVLVDGHYEGELKGLVCHPSKDIFYTVGQDKMLASWNIREQKRIDGYIIKNPANCIDISRDGEKLVIGSMMGDIDIYQANNFNAPPIHAKGLDEIPVETVKYSPKGDAIVAVFKTAVLVYKTNDIKNPKEVLRINYEIEGVFTHMDFSTDGKILRFNTDKNGLKYFNIQTQQFITEYDELSDVTWQTTNCVFGWDMAGIWPQCSLGSDINTCDRTKNNEILVSGDDFSKIKIFRYPCNQEKASFNRYSGHAAAITNLKFNHDDRYLISLGGLEKSIIQWRFHFDPNAQKESDNAMADKVQEEGEGDDDLFGEEQVDKGDEAGAMKPFKGQIKNPTGWKPNNKKYNKKPSNKLELYWAHGVRTQYIEKIDECRNMVKFVEGGKLAYATAGIGVVFDHKPQQKDSTQKFFQKHEEDIVSFAVHPNKKIIATGQMAQKGKAKAIDIFIWDTETMEVLANFHEFHLRAILYLEFSPNGSKLLSVGSDDDNSIAIFDWMNKRMVTNSKVDKSKVNALCWASETEFMTCGAKHAKFWNLSGTNAKAKNGSCGGGKFIPQCCAVYDKGAKCYWSGSADGSIYQWKSGSGKCVAKNEHGTTNKVGSMVLNDQGQLISGGYDGKIIVWDTKGGLKKNNVINLEELTDQQYKKFGKGGVLSLDFMGEQLVVGTLTAEVFLGNKDGSNMKCLINGHYSGETWGACCASDDDRFCSSGGDKCIRLWDISSKKQIKATPPFENDVRAIDWASNGKYIVAGDFKAYLYTLNPKDLSIISGPIKTAQAGKPTSAKSWFWIEEIKCSPNSNYVATGFHGTAGPTAIIQVFKVGDDGSLGKSFKIDTKFSSALLHLDWSCDSMNIIANSQAYELRYFEIDSAENGKSGTILNQILKDMDEPDNPGWSTWTCKLGWPVQGIFQGPDYSDVNAVCRSNNKMVLATGDDNGKVNLYKYPVVVDKQVHHEFNGHSSHVTKVRFSRDDNWLVSIGGNDRTVLLWKTGGIGGEAIVGKDDDEDDDDDDEQCGGPKPKKPKEKTKKVAKEEKKDDNEVFGEEDVDKGDEFAACKPWLGAIKQPSDFDPKKCKSLGKKPTYALHKEYIWGYRCKDTRNNIRYLANGKIVYHAAAVGIVLNTDDNTQEFFNGHIDDITAMDLHPDGKTVITGEVGPKPNIFVWDAETMTHSQNIKAPLQKGIANLQFSDDGSRFAAMAIDVDHQVAVFNTSSGECLFFCDKHPSEKTEISWLGNESFATCGPKGVETWQCAKPLKAKKDKTDGKSCKFATITTHKKKFYVGNSDGSIQIIGGKRVEGVHTSSIQMLQDSAGMILSGGNDGVLQGLDSNLSSKWKIQFGNSKDATIKDPKSITINIEIQHKYAKGLRSASFDSEENPTKLIVGLYCSEIHEFLGFDANSGSYKEHRVLMSGHYTPAQQWLNEVWGLDILANDDDAFVTCADDCTLRKYSISKRKQVGIIETIHDAKKQVEKPDPKTKDPAQSCIGRAVGVNKAGKWAIVGMKDGTVKRFSIDGDHFKHYSTFKHAKEWISDVKFSPDDQKLCIGSHDNAIYGYDSKGDKGWKMWKKKLNKHSSYITHIDFSTDGSVLHSNCGAYELLFWDLDSLKQNPSGATATKDEEWASWNCVLGWPVQGIWPECADGTDINAVDRSHSKALVATSDDFGTVNIFNYPCLKKGAGFRQGKGHSSHVTNVKWSNDDKRLITTGGEDQCVIIWKVVKGGKDEFE